MTDEETYRRAETALLESEGIRDASEQMVRLGRLDSTLRVVEVGEGPPVLFVPGVMVTGVSFANLVKDLLDYRCIMIERPGTGLSPQLPVPPETLAENQHSGDQLLADVMDGLGLETASVVCTSLGGWSTFRGAATHPDRFDRISALAFQIGAPMVKAPWSMRIPVIKSLTPTRVKASRKLVRGMLKSSGMRNAVDKGMFSDEMLDYAAALLRHTDTFGNDTRYVPRALTPRGPNHEVRHSAELLAKVTAPVHLFWGTEDLFGGTDVARGFADLLPHAELQMVEGAGHAPWFDEPDLGLAAVRNHLSGQAVVSVD